MRRMASGGAAISMQRQVLEQAERELQARRAGAEQARATFETARLACESALQAAVTEFEAGEAFRAAKAAADDARTDAAAAEGAALGRLAATDAYHRAQEDLTRAERRARDLSATQPTTSPDRADANQMAAEARAHLADLRARFLNDDPRVPETHRRAATMAAAFDRLRGKFSQKLPQLPAVAAAQKALDAAAGGGQRRRRGAPAIAGTARRVCCDGEAGGRRIGAGPGRRANLQAELSALNARLALGLVRANADADHSQAALSASAAPGTPQFAATVPAPYCAKAGQRLPASAAPQATLSAPPPPPTSPPTRYPQASNPQPFLDPYGPGTHGPVAAPVPPAPPAPPYSYPNRDPYAAVPPYPRAPVVVEPRVYYRTERYYYYDVPPPRRIVIRGGGGWQDPTGGRTYVYGGDGDYEGCGGRREILVYGGHPGSAGREYRYGR